MKRKDTIETWISVKEASALLSEHSGHDVSTSYVHRLGNLGKIEVKQLDGRTKVYSHKDVLRYSVQPRGDGSVRAVARAKKTPA